MSTSKEETLRQFCDVTGADESRSKFFLESSNWLLDVALSSFYEHGGNADETPAPVANPAASVSSLPTLSDSDMESPPESPLQVQKKNKKKAPSSKFATLDSLQQDNSSDEEEVTKKAAQILSKHQNIFLSLGRIRKKILLTVQELTVKNDATMATCSDNAKSFKCFLPKDQPTELSRDQSREQSRDQTRDQSSDQSINQPNKQPNKTTNPTDNSEPKNCLCTPIDNDEADESESKQEIEKLNKEIERLLCENSMLRKEIGRLKGEPSDASHSQSETGQAFYAGGSERSGQQILGPGKGRKDIVTEVFKSVRERGAVVFEDEPSSTSRGRSVFGGVGYRLGQTADDHEPIADGEQQATPQDAPRSVRLRLYREGFTVDSGPLRSYTDPDHAEFLNCVRRGVIPPELSGAGGGEVRVSLEDRRHEDCPRNIAKPQPFTGKGHLLGSPTPVTVGATGGVAADVSDRAANQRAAQDSVRLDAQQPTTTIQFRLADGSRLTGRFNHTHTVADLHEYVSRAEPTYQLQTFSLLTTFPSTELTDPTATLAQANILNTTLLQRLK